MLPSGMYLLSMYVGRQRTNQVARTPYPRLDGVSQKAGPEIKWNSARNGRQKLATSHVHDATSNKRFPRIVGLLPPPRSPFPSSFSFSLQPPSSTSTCLFTTASNLWSSLDSSDGMEAKPKCVSKFGVCIYTKEEEKKEIDSKERERREGRKTPWARICVCIFHLYTWKILLGRIQALWMIRQLLPRWNRFA